jgi:hypothetical protein
MPIAIINASSIVTVLMGKLKTAPNRHIEFSFCLRGVIRQWYWYSLQWLRKWIKYGIEID